MCMVKSTRLKINKENISETLFKNLCLGYTSGVFFHIILRREHLCIDAHVFVFSLVNKSTVVK